MYSVSLRQTEKEMDEIRDFLSEVYQQRTEKYMKAGKLEQGMIGTAGFEPSRILLDYDTKVGEDLSRQAVNLIRIYVGLSNLLKPVVLALSKSSSG